MHKWNHDYLGAVNTRTGPLWELMGVLLNSKTMTTSEVRRRNMLEKIQIEGGQLYSRISGPIHELQGTSLFWQELGSQWTTIERGLVQFYKSRDLRGGNGDDSSESSSWNSSR